MPLIRRTTVQLLTRFAAFALTLFLATAAPAQVTSPASRTRTADPGPRVSLIEFREVALNDAMRLLSEQTGINIVPSAAAGMQKVTAYLRDVRAFDAIETVCQTNDLWFQHDAETGIIRIFTTEEYKRDLGSFRRETTRVFTLLYPNVADVAQTIQDIYGNRVELSFGLDVNEALEDLETRFDKFDIVDEQSQGLGFFEGSGAGARAGESSRFGLSRRDARRSARFRQDSSREERAFRPDALEDISAQDIQSLEAERLGGEITTDAIDLLLRSRRATIFVSVIRKHNALIVRTGDEAEMEQIAELVTRLDVPTPMVLLEVRMMSLLLDDGFDSFFDYQFFDAPDGDASGEFARSPISVPASPGDLIAGVDTGALVFQYVGEEFRSRLQLLETEGRITLLATPVLLTANNEVSRLFVGEERPLNRGFSGSSDVIDNGQIFRSGSSTDVEFRPVGTTLLITPDINSDRTVTLRILTENSNIEEGGATLLIPDGDGFTPTPIDLVQARTVSGTVVAQDTQIVAFGGLIEEDVIELKEKIPVLGSIPVLGLLFRRQSSETVRRELVVMIRPYVISTPADAEKISKSLLEKISIHPTSPHGEGDLDTYNAPDVLLPSEAENTLLKALDARTGNRGAGEPQ